MKQLLCTALSIAYIFTANSQIDIIQSKPLGFPTGNYVHAELDEVPGKGNLLLAFLGAPSDSSNHFYPAESGWTFLTDVISNARLHVFYKFAGASESKVKTFYTPHISSNFTAVLAEYSNVRSIVVFAGSSSDDESDSLHFGPLNALTGQRAVAAFVARQLSTDEILWSDGFQARASVTVDTAGWPLGSAMSDFNVQTSGEVKTTASWATSAEPAGIILLLSEEDISYDILFDIRDEENEPVSGATVTFNGVKNDAGEYTFSGIRSGRHNFRVEKEDYLTVNGHLTVVKDDTVDILLYAVTPGKYYVSAEGDDSNQGNSPRAPWKTINKARSHSFQTGDDVYFRCGDIFTPSNLWTINWEGTEEDPAVIGAYYMDGETAVHGVNDEGRPVISGSDFTVPENQCYGSVNSWRGQINVVSKDYIHIKDLHLYQSGFQGIRIIGDLGTGTNSAHFLIHNVKVEGAYNSGIMVANNPYNYGIIEYCEVSGTSYGWRAGCESGWPVSLVVCHSPFSNTTVRKNYVYENWGEGIGFFRFPNSSHNNAGHGIIEDNIIWNNRRVDIYIDGTEHMIVRRNICLGAGTDVVGSSFASSWADGRTWNQWGIWVNNEKYQDDAGVYSSTVNNVKVYNNLVAGHVAGIGVASEYNQGARNMENIVFYNNTLIANSVNISIGHNVSNYTTSGIEFKNNVSWCPPGDFSNDTGTERAWWPLKITWSNNSWTFPRTYAGSAFDVTTDSAFVKTTGWQDLTEVVPAEFFALTEGSSAISAGANLSSVFDYDFFNFLRPSGGNWDMGAIMSDPSVYTGSPVQHTGLLKAYPNPASNRITVEFEVSEPANVNIAVYDILGNQITILINKQMLPGRYEESFGIQGIAEGLYLIRLLTGDRVVTGRMTIISR